MGLAAGAVQQNLRQYGIHPESLGDAVILLPDAD
jgi:hypothetical protein